MFLMRVVIQFPCVHHRVQVTVSKPHPTLQVFAVMSANHSEVTVIAYNHQVIGGPIATETVRQECCMPVLQTSRQSATARRGEGDGTPAFVLMAYLRLALIASAPSRSSSRAEWGVERGKGREGRGGVNRRTLVRSNGASLPHAMIVK